MTAVCETHAFQAETTQLLDLMVHSLYTNKDIFLRELISNASDALDALRFQSLTNPELLAGDQRLEIRLSVDHAARTLTITDTGLGMTRQGVIDNIGTIARSGTRELRQRIQQEGGATPDVIGRFGVGFYSAFMVASRIRLVTRHAGEAVATDWESAGNGSFTIRDSDRRERGTSITLYLLPPDADAGIEDYTDPWRLGTIVRRYSDFIDYPIVMADPDETILNSMKPIWMRHGRDVKREEYHEFYRHLSHDGTAPLDIIHFTAEGAYPFHALLYVPAKAPYDLYYSAPEVGLRLYAARVLMVEKTDELLPHYLRFVTGVVDATEIPLNISRQRLQQDSHVRYIRKHLTRRILAALQEMFAKDGDRYRKLWAEFGPAIKEGAASDFENRDRLLPLLLFQSSASDGSTTLDEYVARMPAEQSELFYLTGESRRILERSPHLEAVRARGYEVLYLTDPVDELLLQHLPEYAGKKLKSVGKGALQIGDEHGLLTKSEQYAGLIASLQTTLDAHVKQVRLTSRLKDSPVCLVVEEHEYSPRLERLLQKGKTGGPQQRRVLELNPEHPLIEQLRTRYHAAPHDPEIGRLGELLFGLALLAEGSALPDPTRFTDLALAVLVHVPSGPTNLSPVGAAL